MLPLFKVFMSLDVENVKTTLKSGMITQGPKVEEFEKKLKEWFNFPYILTVNSATSGLIIALRLLDLPIGSEVLCTPLTCMATSCSVLENRLSIKWVDVDPETCNMDLNDLERKITEKTKAIIFVHWGGSPIDLDRLKTVAGSIPVIEDCAHSFGAEYHGKKLGTGNNIAVYSLQAIKHLTSGDGGLIFLPNEHLYNRAKLLRWYGISREKPQGIDFRLETDIVEWGYKAHMNDINATIGLCNLPHIDSILQKHRDNAEFYNKNLKDIKGVTLLKQIPDTKSAYWIYTLKVQDKQNFISYMTSKKVAVSQVHNRNDIHSCVSEFRTHLPQLDSLEKEMICIPVGWWLSDSERWLIKEYIKQWSDIYFKKIVIRELLLSDKEPYLALLRELNGYICDPNKFEEAFNCLNSSNRIFVLLVDNVIVSSVKCILETKFSQNVAHLEDVVTDIKHRRRGYASHLLKHAIKMIRNEGGCYKIVLNTNEDNIDFYVKNGFSEKGIEMSLYL